MEPRKRNLVKAGPYSRVVEYESDDIVAAIRRVFADVPRIARATTLVLQRKDDEWGEFIDIQKDETIPDRCILNMVLDSLQVCICLKGVYMVHDIVCIYLHRTRQRKRRRTRGHTHPSPTVQNRCFSIICVNMFQTYSLPFLMPILI